MTTSPIQMIVFGSPGTGKSHYIKTPEYSYGDFMGKLLPETVSGRVNYSYRSGHFLKALARAYRNLLAANESANIKNVALVIDEINRGNSAAIFGTVFQLLDREPNGWSVYHVDISDMEFDTLLVEIGAKILHSNNASEKSYLFEHRTYRQNETDDLLNPLGIKGKQIRLPPNLSLVATMNTSDNSIYYMDTAFKRRWDWQYIDNDSSLVAVDGDAFLTRSEWMAFVDNLNKFIRRNHKYIRKVEDKQIGYWFIASEPIKKAQIQNKIMFYLWDGVFGTNRKPLADLLDKSQDELVTFGDFSKSIEHFIAAVKRI